MPIEFCSEFTISNLSWIIRFPAAMPHHKYSAALVIGSWEMVKGGREGGREGDGWEEREEDGWEVREGGRKGRKNKIKSSCLIHDGGFAKVI